VQAQGLFFRVNEVELAAHEAGERMPSFISLIFKRKINSFLSLPCPAASTSETRRFKTGALLVPWCRQGQTRPRADWLRKLARARSRSINLRTITPNAAQPSLRGVLLHALEHSKRLGDKTRVCALMNGARSLASLEVVRNDRGDGDDGHKRADCDGHPNKTLHTGKDAAGGDVGAAHFVFLSNGHVCT